MRRIWLVVGAVLAAVPAAAQDIAPALDMTLMAGWSGHGAALEQTKRQTGTRLSARSRPASSEARPSMTQAQVIARTSFRPDPAVRARVYARSVTQLQRAGVPAANVALYRQILASGKLRNEAVGVLGRYGMSPDNLVDTTAIYLAASWLAAHGNNGVPSAAQMRGLRAQVAGTMAANPALLAATSAAKQELAEANIVQAALASSAAETAVKNPASAGRGRAAVAGWVRDSYGLDLTRMTLTANGLH